MYITSLVHPLLILRSNSLQISGIHQERPISEVPTASSIYSQPSPEMNEYTTPQIALPPRSSSLYPDDVSPPESPRIDKLERNRSRRDSPDVSPISDSSSPIAGRSPAFGSGRFNSNIPIPKKTRKFWNRPSLEAKEKGSSLTHWDVYSGEPTTSEKGKPPSTTPSAVKLSADPTPGRLYAGDGFGTSTHISGGTNPIGRKRVASREGTSSPIIRPEWKGAGGRHAIVKPMIDKPLPLGIAPTFPAGREKYELEQREIERVREQEIEQEREREREIESAQERVREREQELERERERDQERKRERERERVMEWEREEKMERARQQEREGARASEARARASLSSMPTPSSGHNQIRQPSQPSIMLGDQDLNRSNGFSHINSESSTPTLTPPTYQYFADSQDPQLIAEDRRSPLARNPSNEEMKDRRFQASTSTPQSFAVEATDFDNDQSATRRVKDLPVVPKVNKTTNGSPNIHTVAGDRSESTPRNVSRDSEEEDDPGQIESRFRADLRHMNLEDQPPSRFSTTTYATTVQDSPPATPDVGSCSPAMSGMSTTPDSVLNRKRPIAPAGLPNPRAPARKPTPSEINMPSPLAPESKRKELPKSPPEKQAVSRVATFQAKVDNLRRRRGNLQTVIHELTHVVQPSSIAYDMASRQEIKRTVEGLNKELAEVIKDEHETGTSFRSHLTLHVTYRES